MEHGLRYRLVVKLIFTTVAKELNSHTLLTLRLGTMECYILQGDAALAVDSK